MKRNKWLLISPSYPPPLVGGHMVYAFNLAENCPEDFEILTSELAEGCDEISSPRHNIMRSRRVFSGHGAEVSPSARDLLISYGYMLVWMWKRCGSISKRSDKAGVLTRQADKLIFIY